MSTDSSASFSSRSSSSQLAEELLQSSSEYSNSSSVSPDYFYYDSEEDSDDSASRFSLKSLNDWDEVGSDIGYTPSDIFHSEEDDYEAFFWRSAEAERERWSPEPLLVSWQVKKPPLFGIEFLGTQKLKIPARGESPIDYFNLIVDEEFLNTIVSATNRNAARIVFSERTPSDRSFVWHKLEISEFQTFLGLLYLSGSNFEANWRPSRYFLNPLFPKSMSRDRFLHILKALSFTERDAIRNPQFKTDEIRYFIKLMSHQMSKVYSPGRELCIGTHSIFRTWSEKGTKLCTLVDPVGAVLDVHVCFHCEDCQCEKQSDEIVMKILQPYFRLGHSVFVCTKYGSVRLAKLLTSKKFNYTGKVSPRRDNNITEWLKNHLDDDDCEALYTEDGIGCIKWREKQDEFWLSTEFGHKPVVDTNRPTSEVDLHLKPEPIVRYYEKVARCGRFESFIALDHEGTHYHRLVAKIFSLLLFNASSLYNRFSDGRQVEPRRFREEIIKNLLRPAMAGVRNLIMAQAHFPMKVSKQLQCKYCLTNGWKQTASFICPECFRKPFLCLKCFKPYHYSNIDLHDH